MKRQRFAIGRRVCRPAQTGRWMSGAAQPGHWMGGAAHALATILLLIGCDTALAHHSPAVFDRSREITITGVVREFRWSNPHSWIHLDVEDADGNVATWSVEMNPATHIARDGWTRRTVEPGDRVAIVVHPLRNDEKGGQYISVTLEDGTVMDADNPPLEVVED